MICIQKPLFVVQNPKKNKKKDIKIELEDDDNNHDNNDNDNNNKDNNDEFMDTSIEFDTRKNKDNNSNNYFDDEDVDYEYDNKEYNNHETHTIFHNWDDKSFISGSDIPPAVHSLVKETITRFSSHIEEMAMNKCKLDEDTPFDDDSSDMDSKKSRT